MCASANITREARERWMLRSKGDPSAKAPRVQRTKKEPGSLELSLGKWVKVGRDQ